MQDKDEIYKAEKHKFFQEKIERGVLYIVSTPIGNLEDISFRALRVLSQVDLIAAEDTRVTSKLLNHFGISKEIISYYSGKEERKLAKILSLLQSGKSIAITSDSGTPGISDPGNYLFSACVANEIPMRVIPGATSVIQALVLSTFDSKKFFFQGFLPRKKGRTKTFSELVNYKMPVVIFESPYRVEATLKDIYEHFGNKEISISRELTKKFEETKRGTLREFINKKIKITPKGEFVIIINNKN